MPAGTSANSRRPLGGNQLDVEDIMDHGEASGDIVGHDKDMATSWSPRRTSTSCRLSSRSNRDIKEQETGVELLSKLVADCQLRQGGRQGQLYGFESALKIRRYRYRYGQAFHQR